MTEETEGQNQSDTGKAAEITDAIIAAIQSVEGAAAPPGELITALGAVFAMVIGAAINATLDAVIAESVAKAAPNIPTDEDDNPFYTKVVVNGTPV